MSWFVAYVHPDSEEPSDGPDVATGTGWANWGTWLLDEDPLRTDSYPESAHLAQEGWLEGEESFELFEHELERLLHDMGEPNLVAVTAQILAAVRARPEGTTGIIITDGEPGDESEDEEGGLG